MPTDDWKGAGRNDPCPCGSGKKYKHCHMKLDREAAEEAKAASDAEAARLAYSGLRSESDDAFARLDPSRTRSAHEDEPGLDEEIDRFNALFHAFDAAEYIGKIQICHDAIIEGALDGELVFEFFNELYPLTVEQDERHRFEELANLLAEHKPDLYREQAHWLLDWQITNALFAGNMDEVHMLLDAWSEPAGRDLEVYFHTLDRLAYFGDAVAVLRAMENGLQGLAAHKADYSPYVGGGYRHRHLETVLVDYLAAHPSLQVPDDELLQKLRVYPDVDAEWAAKLVDLWGDFARNQWSLEDFHFRPPQRSSGPEWYDDEEDEDEEIVDPAVEKLRQLTYAFVAYLIQMEQVPPTRALLVRSPIMEYILARHAGELSGGSSSPFRAPGPVRHRKNRRLRATRKRRQRQGAPHPLLPERNTLDRFLARYFGFLSLNRIPAGALFEMMPHWLRFLDHVGLLEAEQREETVNNLSPLHQDLLRIYAQNPSYPDFAAILAQWG